MTRLLLAALLCLTPAVAHGRTVSRTYPRGTIVVVVSGKCREPKREEPDKWQKMRADYFSRTYSRTPW